MPNKDDPADLDPFPQILSSEILKYFGIMLTVSPFGENTTRNNIYLGKGESGEYIIKIDTLDHVQTVSETIALAELLADSDVICSSRFIKTREGENFIVVQQKIVTVQIREDLKNIKINSANDLHKLGRAIAEFHSRIKGYYSGSIKDSDFYEDFMGNDIAKDQDPYRLAEINQFYKQFTPDYSKLSQGIAHNDLNINNIFKVGDKYCFIDFEHVKYAPLVSDLGVIALELWDSTKGVVDYQSKVHHLLQGYEQILKLSAYDKESISIFSMRYLLSDENWYTFWAKRGNTDLGSRIPEVKQKQELLLQICV